MLGAVQTNLESLSYLHFLRNAIIEKRQAGEIPFKLRNGGNRTLIQTFRKKWSETWSLVRNIR
jgi:hypothetical protein